MFAYNMLLYVSIHTNTNKMICGSMHDL